MEYSKKKMNIEENWSTSRWTWNGTHCRFGFRLIQFGCFKALWFYLVQISTLFVTYLSFLHERYLAFTPSKYLSGTHSRSVLICHGTFSKSSFITHPQNRGGVIFSLQSVYVSVCGCVCLSLGLSVCQWTKFHPNGCTNLDAVFTKWLLTALAGTLLKLVNFIKIKWSMVSFWRLLSFL